MLPPPTAFHSHSIWFRLLDLIGFSSSNETLLSFFAWVSILSLIACLVFLWHFLEGTDSNLGDQEKKVPIPEKKQTSLDTTLAVDSSASTPSPSIQDPDESRSPEWQPIDDASWIQRLRGGLTKTREHFIQGLSGLFSQQPVLNQELMENIHEVLYRADFGVRTTDRLVSALESSSELKAQPSWEKVKEVLKSEITQIFKASDQSSPDDGKTTAPWVLLVVGVNGVGKTTTIAKLAALFQAKGKSVQLCAADTYRAAAIHQLQVWGERLKVPVIAHKPGSDPAAVAYDGVKSAIAKKTDILIIDTAGRLHNKKELMDELAKIKRVVGKDLSAAPHETWLVIDATTGQNAVQQIRAFKEVVQITGLIATKLDGTAKGGVLVGASHEFGLPLRYIGVGEKASDLRKFSAQDFAEAIF